MLAILLLSISLSLDALGVGFTYGMRKINIVRLAKVIISIISAVITFLSLTMGNGLQKILPDCITKSIGVLILFSIGFYIIWHGLNKSDDMNLAEVSSELEASSNGEKIKLTEAFYVGVALSLDSMGSGIALSMLGLNNFYLPIAVAVCQYIFLSIGVFSGQKFSASKIICAEKINLISGIVLIIIGLAKIF